MAPKNSPQIIHWGELEDLGSHNTDDSDPSVFYKIKKQKHALWRKSIFHIVTHILAFIIVLPWIVLQVGDNPISQQYNTLVAVVIGFYFGKALFNN